jgi:hypothetical protein
VSIGGEKRIEELRTEFSWKSKRPKHRRKVNIKIDHKGIGYKGVGWIQVVQDTVQ